MSSGRPRRLEVQRLVRRDVEPPQRRADLQRFAPGTQPDGHRPGPLRSRRTAEEGHRLSPRRRALIWLRRPLPRRLTRCAAHRRRTHRRLHHTGKRQAPASMPRRRGARHRPGRRWRRLGQLAAGDGRRQHPQQSEGRGFFLVREESESLRAARAMRRRVLGEAYVDRVADSLDPVAADFQDYLAATAWACGRAAARRACATGACSCWP